MRITKELIAQTCLPIYKKVLEEGKKDNKNKFIKRLSINKADYGICVLFNFIHDTNDALYKFKPLKVICKLDMYGESNTNSPGWYAQIPHTCKTKKEMINCINKRVQLLESWL